MPRFVVALALMFSLVVAPFMSVAVATTLQQPSSQSEESHEEHKDGAEGEASEVNREPPRRTPHPPRVTIATIEVPPARTLRSVAPSLHPAKLSVRRLR